MQRTSFEKFYLYFDKILLSFFGVGFSKYAPGTAGSLLATLTARLLVDLNTFLFLFMTIFLLGLSLWRIKIYLLTHPEDKDPSWIVIDEVVAIFFLFCILGKVSIIETVLLFSIFRFFDIVKPYPIYLVDQKRGALPLMADDLVAALFTYLVISLLRYLNYLLFSHLHLLS